MKNAVFWDVTPRGCCKNRRFGEMYRSVFRLLVIANVSSAPVLLTPMMEAIRSSETSVLTRATFRNISEECILHSHSLGNLKFHFTQLCFRY
jgi:hypothetical protein